MRIPRTRGALSGLLLVALGLWGGLIPFVGPYFHYTIGPDSAWHWTAGRFWLSVLPGIAVVVGGLVLILSTNRATAVLGAWLALVGGLWFAVGQSLSLLWSNGLSQAGKPLGGSLARAVEEIGWFYGLGAVITAIAGIALGRLLVRSVRDVERAAARREADTSTGATAAGTRVTRRRRFRRASEAEREERVGAG